MQDMDILDMNVLDETENDNGIPAEDNENEMEDFPEDENAEILDQQDNKALESEDESRDPGV